EAVVLGLEHGARVADGEQHPRAAVLEAGTLRREDEGAHVRRALALAKLSVHVPRARLDVELHRTKVLSQACASEGSPWAGRFMHRSRRLRSVSSIMPPRCSGSSVSSARPNAWAKCRLSTTPCSCSVSIMTTLAAASPAMVSSSDSNSPGALMPSPGSRGCGAACR